MYLSTNCLPKSCSWWNLNLNVGDAPWLSSAIRYHILVSTANLLVPTTYSRFFSRNTRKLYQSSSYPSTQYTLGGTCCVSCQCSEWKLAGNGLASSCWYAFNTRSLAVNSFNVAWISNNSCPRLSSAIWLSMYCFSFKDFRRSTRAALSAASSVCFNSDWAFEWDVEADSEWTSDINRTNCVIVYTWLGIWRRYYSGLVRLSIYQEARPYFLCNWGREILISFSIQQLSIYP